MRFKLVAPVPESRSFVADAQRAVPLVPGTEDDCCARLMRRLDLPSRDVARTWLTFLRALELAAEVDGEFVRQSQEPTHEHLSQSLLDNVYGARELYETLSETPLDADEAFDRFESNIPHWERHKDPRGWEETWRTRVRRLLDWFVLVGLAASTEAGYTKTVSQDQS